MNERQKRLIEVYEYLRKHFDIHTKTGFAEALGYGRTSLSAAMNGKQDYLTDSLFQSICNKWDGVFNIDYLLTGEGGLLLSESEVMAIQKKTVSNLPDSRDQSTSEVVELLKEQIQILKNQLADKDRLIKLLEHRVSGLEIDLEHYRDPKPVGVPESALR